MGTIVSWTLGIAMIAAFLLAAGGVRFVTGSEHRKQGWLMIVAAMVLVGNVLVWTL